NTQTRVERAFLRSRLIHWLALRLSCTIVPSSVDSRVSGLKIAHERDDGRRIHATEQSEFPRIRRISEKSMIRVIGVDWRTEIWRMLVDYIEDESRRRSVSFEYELVSG
ncbi:hypothetical protein PENTCL1PPCAC_15931, partial [Pristionchus entomophagus]